MSNGQPPAAQVEAAAEALAEAFDELTSRLHAGQAISQEEVRRRYPEHAAELLRLLPALAALEDLGDLSAPDELSALGSAATGGRHGEHVPAVLGDFRLLGEIGRGGMGVVYEAEQVSLGRRVALKVLPLAATLDPRRLQRFHNEARAAAGLHHTNIVPVFAVSQASGVHFYAMQLIEGQSLATVLRDLRAQTKSEEPTKPRAVDAGQPPEAKSAPLAARESTVPRAALSTEGGVSNKEYIRAVARLGVQAAEALDYAHQLGVVHRDVKPANLMVDGRGQLWVTDFGLAQFRDGEGSLTLTGDLIGTLRYMSPEQALAKRAVIDHRTDVYSLGATLYELLTLRPVYDGCTREELLRQIAFEEPKGARQQNKTIPVELETIVQKAMEKNPADRYGTAQELAEDMDRFLKDEPIRARRPTLVQRLRKWCRRHKAFVSATAAVVLIALLLGAATEFQRLQRKAAAEREVELALEDAVRRQEKKDWPEALSAARRAEALLAGGIVNEELQQRVRERRADLEMARKLEVIPGRLEAVGESYDPATRVSAFARAFREFGIDVAALEPGEAAERIRARTISLQLAGGLDDWAMAAKGPTAEKPNRKELLALASAVDPDPLRNRLRDVLGRGDPAGLKELAVSEDAARLGPGSLYRLGMALTNIGGGLSQEAAVALERLQIGVGGGRGFSAITKEATVLFERAQREYPGDFSINQQLGMIYLTMQPPRLEEAVRCFTVTVALRPENPGARMNLGGALFRSGNLTGAIEAFQAAVRLNPTYTFAYNNLGSALRRKGDLDGAIRAYQEGVRLRPDVDVTHLSLGSALEAKGALDEAADHFREVIRLRPKYSQGYLHLGQVLVLRKLEFAQAREIYRMGMENVPDPTALGNLARALKECDHFAALDSKLRKVLSGEAQPANNPERLELARWCVEFRKLNAAAARFYGAAFAEKPQLAADLRLRLRYNAACAAALAGCGQGKDADQLDVKERAGLRKQAADWLRADLEAYRQVLDKSADKTRSEIAQKMRHWQRDTDFDGVRNPEALAKLPEPERDEWRKLWQDVEALARRAADAKEPGAR